MMKNIVLLAVLFSISALAGALCDEADQLYLRNDLDKAQFTKVLESCGRENALSWDIAAETTTCLLETYHEKPKAACLSCFSSTTECARQSCKWLCLWGRTENCHTCILEYCQEALENCTNLTKAELPSW
ncbi:MAG: hypothetical protein WCK42_07190 [Myxococcaceae bacterium]